jgi:hypothetical protein
MNPKQSGGWRNRSIVVNRWTGLLVVALLAGGPLAAAPAAASKKLNVQLIHQEQGLWCWAACAEMVIEFVKPGTDARQCELVKLEMGTSTDCCNSSAGSFTAQCNSQGGFPEESFGAHAIDHKSSETRLSWKRITRQIDDGKPLLYAFFWHETDMVGHMVVIHGYGQAQGKKVLYRRDPNPHPQVGTQTYLLFEDHYRKQIHNETWYDITKASNN